MKDKSFMVITFPNQTYMNILQPTKGPDSLLKWSNVPITVDLSEHDLKVELEAQKSGTASRKDHVINEGPNANLDEVDEMSSDDEEEKS